MPIRSVTLRILGDGRSARSEMDWVNAQADKLNKKKVNVNITADTPAAKLDALRIKLAALQNMHTNIKVDVDDKNSQLAFARINQQLLRIDRTTAKPKISVEGLARAQTELAATDLAFGRLIKSTNDFGNVAATQSNRMKTLFAPGGGFGRFGGLFGGRVALFGGLASIGAIHLLVDAVAEVLAVVLPATIALVAFGVAGASSAQDIFTHMKNLNTVMKATGGVIPPMTGALTKLQNAVKPAVYQIFGDALTVMNNKTGLFSKLAMGTAGVMTHLAARMTVAITSGKGMSAFMQNAVPDVAKLGDAFGNLFGILGNLLKVMPGYAGILLTFGDAILKVAEWVTHMAAPIIGLGLAVHGFIVWAGLGASAAFFLGKAIYALGTTTIGAAIKTFAVFVADLATVALTEGLATAATFAFSGALAAMAAVNPVIWIGAAIGGLVALALWMGRSKSATTAWGDSLQKAIDNASTVTQGLHLTQNALVSTSNRLGAASAKLANTQQFQNQVNLHTGTSFKVLTGAYRQQQGVVSDLTVQQRRFAQEQQFNQGRLGGLTKAYGSQSNAMALLSAAGVTQQEWQTKGAEGWAIITQKINGTLAGYKAMGQTQGTLGNDLQVMDRGIQDQYTAMQKLNQAWDQFITDVTGTQNSFDTAALGLKTLAISARGSHTSIDGLNKASLTLNQNFTQQIGTTSTMIDSWRTAGVAGNLFTRGVKDSIAPLVRYAHGSGEATAQLVALAQQAGYNGPNSLKTLVKWLGNTHDSLQTVKHVTNQATMQEALLTGSMRAQGNYIANTLIGEINKGIMGYTHVADAARKYGDAIARSGRQSDAARAARKNLIDDIIKTGVASHDSTGKIAAMISKVLGIPLHRALEIVMDGKGTYSVKQGIFPTPSGRAPAKPIGVLATGGPVIGPGTGTSDSVPIWASHGEYMIKTASVNKYGKGFLDAINSGRYADGGLVQHGDLQVLSGQRAVTDYNAFSKSMQDAMVSHMRSGIKQAVQAVMSVHVGGYGAGAGQWRGTVLKALAMEGLSAGLVNQVLLQIGTESGGNPNAINLTDSNAAAGHPSQGLLQTIPGTFSAYHWPGTSWNIDDPLANIAAAINYARHVYGPFLMAGGMGLGSGHGYASGTPGAIPGWAWVGERGPELVNMHGGEEVLDASTSRRATRGYAGGAAGRETLAGLELMKDIMGVNKNSNNSFFKMQTDYLKTIAKYYDGSATARRDGMVKTQTAAMLAVAQNLRHNLKGNLKGMDAYKKTIDANLAGTGDLSNLTLGPTAGIGDNVALSGGQGLSIQLTAKIASMKQFGAALKTLHKMGLPASLFKQIVAMGPDAGLPYANEIISGGPGFIKKLAGQETQLRQAEHVVSQGASSSVFLNKWETGATFWKTLPQQRAMLEREFKNLGKVLGQEAARWFVPNKHRRPKGFARGGILREPVWGMGISGQEYSFGEEGAEYFAPMHAPHSGGRRGGGDTYNITVHGDTDPDGAALKIIQKVRDYKRHHGNQPTGIG